MCDAYFVPIFLLGYALNRSKMAPINTIGCLWVRYLGRYHRITSVRRSDNVLIMRLLSAIVRWVSRNGKYVLGFGIVISRRSILCYFSLFTGVANDQGHLTYSNIPEKSRNFISDHKIINNFVLFLWKLDPFSFVITKFVTVRNRPLPVLQQQWYEKPHLVKEQCCTYRKVVVLLKIAFAL